VLCCNSFTKHK